MPSLSLPLSLPPHPPAMQGGEAGNLGEEHVEKLCRWAAQQLWRHGGAWVDVDLLLPLATHAFHEKLQHLQVGACWVALFRACVFPRHGRS